MASNGITRRHLFAGAAVTVGAHLETSQSASGASDPLDWTLTSTGIELAKRTISSEELTKLCLARIGKLDSRLNAFITLNAESALRRARECDRERRSGKAPGRLHGIPSH